MARKLTPQVSLFALIAIVLIVGCGLGVWGRAYWMSGPYQGPYEEVPPSQRPFLEWVRDGKPYEAGPILQPGEELAKYEQLLSYADYVWRDSPKGFDTYAFWLEGKHPVEPENTNLFFQISVNRNKQQIHQTGWGSLTR